MNVIPDNHRKKWTETENNTLKNEIKCKIPFHIIAKNHKRTIGAIKYKLIRNAIAEINDVRNEFSGNIDVPIEYLMIITNLSKCELLEGFKKLKCNYDVSIDKVVTNERHDVYNWLITTLIFATSSFFMYYIAVISFFNISNL